jgi:hypothetical protein
LPIVIFKVHFTFLIDRLYHRLHSSFGIANYYLSTMQVNTMFLLQPPWLIRTLIGAGYLLLIATNSPLRCEEVVCTFGFFRVVERPDPTSQEEPPRALPWKELKKCGDSAFQDLSSEIWHVCNQSIIYGGWGESIESGRNDHDRNLRPYNCVDFGLWHTRLRDPSWPVRIRGPILAPNRLAESNTHFDEVLTPKVQPATKNDRSSAASLWLLIDTFREMEDDSVVFAGFDESRQYCPVGVQGDASLTGSICLDECRPHRMRAPRSPDFGDWHTRLRTRVERLLFGGGAQMSAAIAAEYDQSVVHFDDPASKIADPLERQQENTLTRTSPFQEFLDLVEQSEAAGYQFDGRDRQDSYQVSGLFIGFWR